MTDTLTKLAYQTFQQGRAAFGLAHKSLSTQILNVISPPAEHRQPEPIPEEMFNLLSDRRDELLDTDWQDAERGVYSAELLFDNPWDDFFRYYPLLFLDMAQISERANGKRYQEFSPNITTEGYPSYYIQNFHHQTDGYLSDTSANLYDTQVEILFNGTADPMRRRVLAPLKDGLTGFDDVPAHQIRVLDIACGTGRTLRFVRGTLPHASLHGTDLSPAYLRKANQSLSQRPGELPQLVQANAENLPYQDDYFHGITSVFLFHELPADARQAVIDQAFRVLKPGGVFVICDSIQEMDSPEFAVAMRNFPKIFHEPYYRHYITDDLVARLESAGFTDVSTSKHFMSKYWVAHKAA
jgi:ubiquinone/menaquinone biosynthesis C-methylase UbiE